MTVFHAVTGSRRKAVWGPKRTLAAAAILLLAGAPSALAAAGHAHSGPKAAPGQPNSNVKNYKIDGALTSRAANPLPAGKSQVIVELQPGATLPAQFAQYAKRGRLGIINAQTLELPDRLITQLASQAAVFRVHLDRPAAKFNYRTSLTVGTTAIRQTLGFTGRGIGVAVIDSGIATWHDDLTNKSSTIYPYGNQRVAAFVDFVNGQTQPYDDDGHGTHVSGIIAGNGYDSNGQKAGAAPDASLISLKVLDGNGNGTISNIIAALDWVVANRTRYNIRVVNMSVGAPIHESAWTDPLTLAAKRVVDAGVVVVAAAGNFGKNSLGQPQYGGISAPGNAPWVLTVGGSSTQGTADRADDVIGSYSSRGPTFIDFAAKPDLVAPGTGTVSLLSAGSTFALTKLSAELPGSFPTASMPYLSLTGTSMAAPVVAGTVALMLQANPSLTPNAVKAILQYTAQQYPNYDALTEGAGFLNAVGAVRLARYYATARPGVPMPKQAMWSKHIIWGNHLLVSGNLKPGSNAFAIGTTWGAATTSTGDNIVWGTAGDGDNIVWGTDCGGADCDNIVWGTSDGDNIVWGTSSDGDNIVWGSSGLDGDNIVWGSSGADGDNIVWGTDSGDNIVWGTSLDGDNIVWGTDSGDNIVWGTSVNGNVVWGATGSVQTVTVSSPNGSTQQLSGADVFDLLEDSQLLKVIESTAPPPPPPAVSPTLALTGINVGGL